MRIAVRWGKRLIPTMIKYLAVKKFFLRYTCGNKIDLGFVALEKKNTRSRKAFQSAEMNDLSAQLR
jgi:hypothetical protein